MAYTTKSILECVGTLSAYSYIKYICIAAYIAEWYFMNVFGFIVKFDES